MKKFFLLSIIALFNFSVDYAQIPTKGLMAYYPFNGNANDSSGNGNNGVVNGATLTKDRFGNSNSAYSFDGENDYILVNEDSAHISSLRADTAVTISAWVYVIGNQTRHTVLVKRYNLYNSPYNSYGLCASAVADTQYWQASNYNTDYDALATQKIAPVVQNKWIHLLQKSDGKKVYMYVNGKLQYTIDAVGQIGYSAMPLYIGTGATIQGQYMKGYIDDIRIYNYALSANEINALYKEGDTTTTALKPLENNASGFNIYPNPANNYITIENLSAGLQEAYKVKIMNVLGQEIYNSQINKHQNRINLTGIASKGIYILNITDANNTIICQKKFIVQ